MADVYGSNTSEELSALSARISTLEGQILDKTEWMGEWVPGNSYSAKQQVLADGWLSIANKVTQDDPRPYGLGNREWITQKGDTPTWTNQDTAVANTLLVGVRFRTPVDQAFFRYGVRVWIPNDPALEGVGLAVWAVENPNGAAPVTSAVIPEISIGSGDLGKWFTFNLERDFLPLDTEMDLVAVFASRSNQQQFSGNWLSIRSNAAPLSGEVTHGANQSAGSRFHFTDADAGDRQTDLSLVTEGDLVEESGITYTVTGALTNASDQQLFTEPHLRPVNGLHSFLFTRYGSTTIPYEYDLDGWLSDVDFFGLISTTGYDNIVANDNKYGMDVEVEGASMSPDWDIQAYT